MPPPVPPPSPAPNPEPVPRADARSGTRSGARSSPAAKRRRVGLGRHAAEDTGQPLHAGSSGLCGNVQLLHLRRWFFRLLDRLDLRWLRDGHGDFLLVGQLRLTGRLYLLVAAAATATAGTRLGIQISSYLFGSIIAGFGPATPGIMTRKTMMRNADDVAGERHAQRIGPPALQLGGRRRVPDEEMRVGARALVAVRPCRLSRVPELMP